MPQVTATIRRSLLLAVAFVVAALALWASPAAAHAELLASDPADGSVLDAGGLVEDRGALRRRPVGIPATDLPGGATAATGLATCDCAGFTAEAKAAFLASRRSHPDPDIRLAETIGRLEARGNAARTSFRNLFIRYSAPGAADPISAAADRIAIGVVARAGEGPETARGKA